MSLKRYECPLCGNSVNVETNSKDELNDKGDEIYFILYCPDEDETTEMILKETYIN
jgi:hypothetical protein